MTDERRRRPVPPEPRAQIVGLTLKPGTVLARPALCDYFKLSQSPIREALLRLEEERLVDIYPQHQTRVRAIDLAAVRQHLCGTLRALDELRALPRHAAAGGLCARALTRCDNRRRGEPAKPRKIGIAIASLSETRVDCAHASLTSMSISR